MLLSVKNLSVESASADGPVPLLLDVSLDLPDGRTLALIGESGSGKSLTALSILGLLPAGLRIAGGTIRFENRDLARLSPRELRAVRGARIGLIAQEPMSCLNPVRTIGEQVGEPLRVRGGVARREAQRAVEQLLERVGLQPGRSLRSAYPHELSGGMCQRVMIAMALICRPALLLADEPTTALDVNTQAQILDLLRELQTALRLTVLFITHDLSLAAQVAHETAVMYSGRIVETGPTEKLLRDAWHPYTQGLLRSLDLPSTGVRSRPLHVIAGEPPMPRARPAGCAFHPRCARGREQAECLAVTPALELDPSGRGCACWLAPPHAQNPRREPFGAAAQRGSSDRPR